MTRDGSLVRRALRGDEAAFGELYDRHAGIVYSYALRMLGNRHNAEDVLQEVFLSIVRNGRSYDSSRPFVPWLIGITRRATINQHHRGRRSGIRGGEGLMSQIEARFVDPDVSETIEKALSGLPGAFCEALWLCDGLGLSYKESATIMNCDPKTVGSRLSRARKMVHEHVSRNDYAL